MHITSIIQGIYHFRDHPSKDLILKGVQTAVFQFTFDDNGTQVVDKKAQRILKSR